MIKSNGITLNNEDYVFIPPAPSGEDRGGITESEYNNYNAALGDVSQLKSESTERLLAVNERFSMVEDASFIKQSLPDYIFTFMHIDAKGRLTTNGNKNVCFKSAIFAKKGLKISVDSGYKYQYALYDIDTGAFISRETWKTELTILGADCKINVEISDEAESVLSDLSIVEHLHMGSPVAEVASDFADENIQFVKGENIKLAYDIGTTIDLTPENVSTYSYAIHEVKPGDTVVINAKGGINPRVWGFVDENNVLISVADSSTAEKQQVDLHVVTPDNATKIIINSKSNDLGHCYVYGLYKKFEIVEEKTSIHDQSITKLEEDVSSLSGEEQNALRQSNNIIYTMGIDTFKNKVLEIAQPIGYKSWSFIGKVKNKLICLYSVGTSHTDSRSNIFYKVSENGIVWSVDRKIISTDNQRDNVTGKGYDNDGNFVFWVRRGSPGYSTTKFELYKTVDGNTFEMVSSNLFATATGHIGDIVNVEGHGMFAFWNNYGDSRSWGYVKSTDNGVTWTETAVESNLPVQNCPVEMSPVYLGNGKILVMGRQDATSTLGQFQIQSNDYGETFTKQSTNITDILQSTPSVIYSSENDLVSMYYFARSNGKLMLREMLSSEIWNSPTSWGQAIEVAQVSGRGQDCGNVNACQFNEVQIASFYSGDATNTGIYEVIR